jgi:hypothetical protein
VWLTAGNSLKLLSRGMGEHQCTCIIAREQGQEHALRKSTRLTARGPARRILFRLTPHIYRNIDPTLGKPKEVTPEAPVGGNDTNDLMTLWEA